MTLSPSPSSLRRLLSEQENSVLVSALINIITSLVPSYSSTIDVVVDFGLDFGSGWRSAPPRAMKILSWNCRGVGNLATFRELKQLFVANVSDIVFLCETKIHSNRFTRIRSMCRMEGCLAVNLNGKSNGLALLWRKGVRVTV
ncbi:hypothetical protein J1N35_007813 [Gossypium stocksii]|uniref:Endonuclease/exonuclease/phosphatase domain-containing protein n=1 Tax=Gossypium stocksii TaxID=47602 RepID=A0A9D4AFX6_9ROSI|nr:hypothetical protein J1N35_007813 [Gossypium stocksii]